MLRDTPLAGLETEVAELVLQRGTAALMAAERLPIQYPALYRSSLRSPG